jgi:CheY-like chemotaxis protein
MMSTVSAALTVLLVEDDTDIREAVGEVLADHGYQVVTAGHGAAALEQLRDGSRPDVILLDIMMPVMDGATFRAAQKADPALAAIPVVVMTALASAKDAPEWGDVAAFPTKPIKLDALLAAVARVASR